MKKIKIKRQKVKKYSVIVIPDNRSRVWRWEVTRKKIESALAAGVTIMFVMTGSIWGLAHYRDAYVATDDIRLQNAKFEQERSELVTKLATLEQAVERTERFAGRLESSIGINPDSMQKGIGPLTGDGFSKPASVQEFDSLKFSGHDSNKIVFSDLDVTMNGLEFAVSTVENRLHTVYQLHQDRATYWASMPSVWPSKGWVTSGFGPRHAPLRGGSSFHKGIDIAASPGTPIIAPGDGVVTYAGYKSGLGKVVMIDHGYGLVTLYGHNSVNYVKEGDHVKRGELIASIGATGLATGPHLHYQVEVDGVPVDPMKYIENM